VYKYNSIKQTTTRQCKQTTKAICSFAIK